MLEGFLEDHVTMKTEAMAAEDSALPSLIIINTFILNSKEISQYYCNATFFNSGVYV